MKNARNLHILTEVGTKSAPRQEIKIWNWKLIKSKIVIISPDGKKFSIDKNNFGFSEYYEPDTFEIDEYTPFDYYIQPSLIKDYIIKNLL